MQATFYILILILALCFWYTTAAPSSDDILPPEPPIPGAPFRFQNLDAPKCLAVDTLSSQYAGIKDPNKRWQNFNVKNDPLSDEQQRAEINNAMYELSQHLPCVNFGIYKEDATAEGDYIQITRENDACTSFIGKNGGEQLMNLAHGCYSRGVILHEMLHALGLAHEQMRYDRDDYVTVHYENIEDQFKFAFDKVSSEEFDNYNVEYNINSIMHYGSHDFSKNGEPTITAKNGQEVGSKGVLQDSDIRKIKAMYNC